MNSTRFYNLPKLTKYYLPENDMQEKIDKILNSDQHLIIFGKKGSGKTSKCLFYALNTSFSKIFFLSCDSNEKFQLEFRNLAECFDIPTEAKEFTTVIQKLINELELLKENVLLILENLEDYDYIKDFLNLLPKNAKVIITTQYQFPLEDKKSLYFLKQNLFDLNSAEKYLLNVSKYPLSLAQIKSILNFLSEQDNLILPFNLEKTFICLNKIGLDEFIRNKNSNKKNSIFLLEELIKKLGLNDILNYLIFLDPDFISIDFIQNLFELNLKLVQEKLEKLEKLSLIEFRNKNSIQGIRMSSIVQEELIEISRGDSRVAKNILDSYVNLLDFLNQRFDLTTYEDYFHAVKILSLEIENLFGIDLKNKNKIVRINLFRLDLFRKLAWFNLAHTLDFKLSIEYYMQVLRLQETYFEEEKQELADTYYELGLCCDKLKDYKKSLEFKIECVKIRKTLPESSKLKLAEAYENLGSTYDKLGDLNSSTKFDLKAAEIKREFYESQDSLDLAKTLFNLGHGFSKQNAWDTAAKYFMESYEIRDRIYKKSRMESLMSLNGLVSAFEMLGNQENARIYRKIADKVGLEIEETDMNDLTVSYVSQLKSSSQDKEEIDKRILEQENNEEIKAEDMSSDQVEKWLREKEIEPELVKQIIPIDGGILRNYFLVSVENEKLFQYFLKKETNFQVRSKEIKKFIKDLKELFIKNLI